MRRVLIGALVVIGLAGAGGCTGSSEQPGGEGATSKRQPESAPTGTRALSGRIAFADDVRDVYVINADGTGLTKLTSHPGNDFDPAWSPDGTRIAFRSERDGNNEIYVMNADGSGARNVSNYSGDDWGPAWSPDGDSIAFNSNRDGPDLHLYVVRPDGSGVERIGGDIWVEYPAWSPDGRKIAFMAQTWADGDNYEIYVMNADGSAVRRLTHAPGSDGHPAWSPDSRKIAFNSERADPGSSPAHRIYTMNADGSGQRRLTRVFGKYPDWSPDGRRIIFTGGHGLFIVDADGSRLTRLATKGIGAPVFPDWVR
jgi:Tol biopolymer transport system component